MKYLVMLLLFSLIGCASSGQRSINATSEQKIKCDIELKDVGDYSVNIKGENLPRKSAEGLSALLGHAHSGTHNCTFESVGECSVEINEGNINVRYGSQLIEDFEQDDAGLLVRALTTDHDNDPDTHEICKRKKPQQCIFKDKSLYTASGQRIYNSRQIIKFESTATDEAELKSNPNYKIEHVLEWYLKPLLIRRYEICSEILVQ